MQASLDDLLGAVYSLIYARNHGYDERKQALGEQDMQAVRTRAKDMSDGKVRTDGKWTAGFYFNNSQFRISAVYHRILKIVTGNENKDKVYIKELRKSAKLQYRLWKKLSWADTDLAKVHTEVNNLKHTAGGIYNDRDIQFSQALASLNELLILVEAWAQ